MLSGNSHKQTFQTYFVICDPAKLFESIAIPCVLSVFERCNLVHSFSESSLPRRMPVAKLS